MQKKVKKEELIEKVYSVLREELVATFTKTADGIDVRLVYGQEFTMKVNEKERK